MWKGNARRRRALHVAGALAALGMLLAACGGMTTAQSRPPAATPPAIATSEPSVTSDPASTEPSAPAEPPGMPRVEPAALRVPKIGAQSSLVSLGLNPDGTVQVPPVDQPQQAGWYSYGPAPGEVGPAVLLGHVDGNHKLGIFYRLRELAPGDEVDVDRKDGTTLRFTVQRATQVPKDQFPTEAVYGDTNDAQLRLITCGGSFDAAQRSYRDNIIVYATMAGMQ